MDLKDIENIMEAVLFVSGDTLSFCSVSEKLGITLSEVKSIAQGLAERYNGRESGLEIVILEDNLKLVAKSEYNEHIRGFLVKERSNKRNLSRASLEILAIVAYNQPVTKAYIEQIRGVDSSYLLGILLEKGYIEECGKLDAPGRPNLYSTSLRFLELFGFSSINDLPDPEKFNPPEDGLQR